MLKQVTFADNSKYTFDYTSYGQINRFNTYAPDGHLLAYTSYNMQTGGTLADCPRFSERRDWAQNRNFVGGVASEAVTAYTVDPSGSNGWTQITYPDNTKHKEIFATSGWQTGLTTRTEEYDAANTMQKWTTTTWTQDNLYAGYQINPRPTDADIYDASGNHKHTHIEYTAYASFTLPNDVTEYDSNGTTPLRRTHTDYRWDQGFLDHYVIGLPAIKYVYDGGGGLLSKLEYHYDWAAPYMISQGTPVQHDEANYGSSFIFGRGNLTGVGRWNVFAPNDQSQAIYVSLLRYNTNGSVYFTEDAAGHQTNINYNDSYSDGINRNTMAYPATVTNADGYTSTMWYSYDLGAVTRTQSPPAAGQTEGAVQVMFYEQMGRIQNLITHYNGADYAL